jgi:catechol 2,3-dioxygenase-like lactoylglutathione lyase family enzyme
MLGVAPILPSRDLEATTAFYGRLGFELSRGEVGLHLFCAPDIDPSTSIAGCYLYVEDADALFAEFSSVGLPGAGIPRLHGAPQDSDYGLRESALVDPDGNLLRIGSFIGQPASGQPG